MPRYVVPAKPQKRTVVIGRPELLDPELHTS
jgi:hypothetical protein